MARVATGDGQRRRPLGAVPRAGARERRRLQLRHRPVPQQREERRLHQRAGRLHLSRRSTASPAGIPDSKPKWWNFSPRVGVAWDVTGDGRMAVRSSYGVAYDFPTAERHNINTQSPPWGNRSLVENPPGGFDNPYGHIGGDPHPIVTSREVQFIPFGAFGATDPPSIRRASSRGTSPSSGRSAATGASRRAIWAATPTACGCRSSRTRASSSDRSLRPWRPVVPGVQHGGEPERAPPLSLSGENPSSAALIGNLDLHTEHRHPGLSRPAAVVPSSRGDRRQPERQLHDLALLRRQHDGRLPAARAGSDQPGQPRCRSRPLRSGPHAYRQPVGRRRDPGVRQRASRAPWPRAGGLSGIFNARSGSWLNVTTGSDRALNGQRFQEQRVNQVSDDVVRRRSQHLPEPAAFAQPALGTFGNYERNSITGPALLDDRHVAGQADHVRPRRRRVELRLEAFNLLNNFNWGTPGPELSAGTFGRITSNTGDMRILQFGIKYGF